MADPHIADESENIKDRALKFCLNSLEKSARRTPIRLSILPDALGILILCHWTHIVRAISHLSSR